MTSPSRRRRSGNWKHPKETESILVEPVSRISIAAAQIAFARKYVRTLLDDLDEADWHRKPEGAPTHIAWQVGHLTMAMYMLTLFRLRGKTDDDEALVPKAYLKRFVKGSTPATDLASHPAVGEIRQRFDGVYDCLMETLPTVADSDLDAPVVEPYVGTPNRFGSLLFCAHHEMLHAGQIGLIRRLLGKPPVR